MSYTQPNQGLLDISQPNQVCFILTAFMTIYSNSLGFPVGK